MRAAVLHAFGAAPVVGDVAELQPGGMTAKVLFSTLTPVDRVVAAGRFPVPVALPLIGGKEGVAEIIDGNGRFAAGTRVYFEFRPTSGGAFAERVTLGDEDFLVELGPDIDPRQAAALGGSTGITAWTALAFTAQLQAGETVLVLGATGPVGGAAVAIAKILGAARIVAAGRNTDGLERARAAGADAVVNVEREAGRLADAFREATNGGPHVVFDPVSGPIAQAALLAARPGGRLVQIGRASGDDLVLPAAFMAKALRATGYANFIAPMDVRKQNYRNILDNIARGTISAPVEVRSLEDFSSAWNAPRAATSVRYLIAPNPN